MEALQGLLAAVRQVPPQQLLVAAGALLALAGVLYLIWDAISYRSIPTLNVPLTEDERAEQLKVEQYVPTNQPPKGKIPCYDPATMQYLGDAKAMTPAEVKDAIAQAHVAAKVWRQSSFKQRRLLLRILLKYIIEHQDEICRVSVRDSGKTPLDAVLGEIVVTVEKLQWLIADGEAALKPQHRKAGVMAFYKAPRLEFVPVGVVGAIVPWNWPFHNIINPISAAVFAGNAIVIKVSEHTSWSLGYYRRIMDAALDAAGAPRNLVTFVTGYGDAGAALVTGGVDAVVFVGSTEVGKKVMASASERLTPVTLELGGKDAFIVCQDADLQQVVPIAIKAAFLNCGQNCAGGERFFVHSSVYDKFVSMVTDTVRRMRQGPGLGQGPVDAGAMGMPGLAEKVGRLVDDAVSKGAQALTGGRVGREGGGPGQFYPPTVLAGVTRDMDIWTEEVFGPVMSVIPFANDDEAVALANDCPFGLGASVFSNSRKRGRSIAARLEAGMVSINDFNATYMSQGLPFGGVKYSGFGRFAGVEGLRSLCHMKSVSEDRWPLMKTTIPAPWLHPVGPSAVPFAMGLITMFYGPSLAVKAKGLVGLLRALLIPSPKQQSDKKAQ